MRILLITLSLLISNITLSQIKFKGVYYLAMKADSNTHETVSYVKHEGTITYTDIENSQECIFKFVYNHTKEDTIPITVQLFDIDPGDPTSPEKPHRYVYYSKDDSYKIIVEGKNKDTWIYFNFDKEKQLYLESYLFLTNKEED